MCLPSLDISLPNNAGASVAGLSKSVQENLIRRISHYEAGVTKPTRKNLEKLAEVLEVCAKNLAAESRQD